MKTLVFLGPSLPVEEAKKILPDAMYFPPVKQSDLVSYTKIHQPDVIALIDGEFGQALSVWHKEILYAIHTGVTVIAGGSMGAIRAVETEAFGTIGVGEIFKAFKSGLINDDDEVALLHGDEEIGYKNLSEPMINIRATIAVMRREGKITDKQAEELSKKAKELFYPERTIHRIFQGKKWKSLKEKFKACYRNVKKEDAIAVLEYVRDLKEKPENTFKMQSSHLFEAQYERDRFVKRKASEVPLAFIDGHVALNNKKFHDLNFDAKNRQATLLLASFLRVSIIEDDVIHEEARFRCRLRLVELDKFMEWVRENDMNYDDFQGLMQEMALCRKIHKAIATLQIFKRNTRPILDQLRIRNEYVKWANKAAEEEKLIQEKHPDFKQSQITDEPIQKLIQEHQKATGIIIDNSYDEWMQEVGFHHEQEFKLELVRSKLARETKSKIVN